MKKMKLLAIIVLIILICIIGFFIGHKFINKDAANSSDKQIKTTETSTKTSTQKDTVASTKSNENSNAVNTQSTKTQTIATQSVKVKNVSTQGNQTQETPQNQGTIIYKVPNGSYTQNTILVTNTTGKDISSGLLNEYLRSWIMEDQNNCEGICDATGTFWGQPWLNKVSDKTVVNAFIDANGEAALSENITASEFVKTTQQLDLLTINSVPFTLAQAKAIILNMLQQDNYATPSEVTKIVLEQGAPSVYEVYTKQSGNNIYWTVDANTGYAHG
ncbi:PepSY domain-containing protein [uncultured Clostridium sp.]|uniref:PepSY domain-containing protein n=1 Tax=uncultured Clostridium sp. TaxID=59620 RepID=UPI0026245BB3|nr:PepSY domain-containing protein [uncultured Clostridium sp.]